MGHVADYCHSGTCANLVLEQEWATYLGATWPLKGAEVPNSNESEWLSGIPELFIGIVHAVGTDSSFVEDSLSKSLDKVGFDVLPIRVVELLDEIELDKKDIHSKQSDERYKARMDAGNKLRERVGSNSAMAMLAVQAVLRIRNEMEKDGELAPDGNRRVAFTFRSLKRPEEVELLRDIYGPRFLLVAAYSPKDVRQQNLASKIAESHNDHRSDPYEATARQLIDRDLDEIDQPYGQNVQDTFPLADVFIDASNESVAKSEIDRFIELFFGNPFHTPTIDEYGMFLAHAASLTSSAMSRQVGAAILGDRGEVMSLGANEVPSPSGGRVWPTDNPDERDFKIHYNTRTMRRNVLVDILTRLEKAGLIEKNLLTEDDSLKEGEIEDLLQGSMVMDLIEFERPVHAEMAALVDAARMGVKVGGLTLYSTTFPCHHCARHIVAAALRRVVYVEPYPKSLGPELYQKSISVDEPTRSEVSVKFEAYVGVSPRQFMNVFQLHKAHPRRDNRGSVASWNAKDALPRNWQPISPHFLKEKTHSAQIKKLFEENGIHLPDITSEESRKEENHG